MINENNDVLVQNKHIKSIIAEYFREKIQFCESDHKNKAIFVFSSSISTADILNILRSLDTIKSAATAIRQSLEAVDFGLHDRFGDAEELKRLWRTTKMPDELLSFFSLLFNIRKTTLLQSYHENLSSTKFSKIGSIF